MSTVETEAGPRRDEGAAGLIDSMLRRGEGLLPLPCRLHGGWIEYAWEGGARARIERPLLLLSAQNGVHQVTDGQGVKHYVSAGWREILLSDYEAVA
jgi:hypothetical protein